MTREETARAIKIMQAYVDGAEIEYNYGEGWEKVNSPCWGWELSNYRVKPQPTYKPYDDVSEVCRDKWVKAKNSGVIYQINTIDTKTHHVRIDKGWYTLKELFNLCEYEDSTPCGKVVSE